MNERLASEDVDICGRGWDELESPRHRCEARGDNTAQKNSMLNLLG